MIGEDMSNPAIVRSVVTLVWYPEASSVTNDELDAIIEGLFQGVSGPDDLPSDKDARRMDWVEPVKLLFEAAAFVKTCIEIYEMAPTVEEARKKVEALSDTASSLGRS
jgi:hypothetical protein